MYGVVLGKHKQISLKELDLVQPDNLSVKGEIATFETKNPGKIATLAGIIKRGKLIKIDEIGPADIIGTNDSDLGKYLKKKGLTRRFKEVELSRTDDEVKSKGKEYIIINDEWEEDDMALMVEGYQNIGMYELIDFEKPVNSMQIGMMPAKLAHMMINIGLGQSEKQEGITLYDPFVGLGTTAFLANACGFDCIASDIEISPMKQNLARWEKQSNWHNDKRVTLFKHDIFEPLKKPFLKNADLIVSEGWLGPVITERTPEREIYKAQDEIVKLYKAFLNNIDTYYEHITAVFTIPIHQDVQSYVRESVEEWCTEHKLHIEIIPEVYKRPKQKIGRQIVIVKK